MPSWFPVLKAAQYMGIPPWELEEHPHWLHRGLMALNAENSARNVKVQKVH